MINEAIERKELCKINNIVLRPKAPRDDEEEVPFADENEDEEGEEEVEGVVPTMSLNPKMTTR
jgi:hypothetical protein